MAKHLYEFTMAELVDIMVSLGHMESECKESYDIRPDETNKNNLNRVTELKEKVTGWLTKRVNNAYNVNK